jgi:hypothetical protein
VAFSAEGPGDLSDDREDLNRTLVDLANNELWRTR